MKPHSDLMTCFDDMSIADNMIKVDFIDDKSKLEYLVLKNGIVLAKKLNAARTQLPCVGLAVLVFPLMYK